MSKQDIIRAWKDEEYRNRLGTAELRALPENPAGMVELTDIEMEAAAGAGISWLLWKAAQASIAYCNLAWRGVRWFNNNVAEKSRRNSCWMFNRKMC